MTIALNTMKKAFFVLIIVIVAASCHRKTVPRGLGNGEAATETGYASYYADNLNGHATASGEAYNSNKLTAAHRKLPFATMVTVTNLKNGKQVTVRVNDRGPFVSGRIIDVSKAAAKQIDMVGAGVAKVKITYRKK